MLIQSHYSKICLLISMIVGICTSFTFINYLPRFWSKYLSTIYILAWLAPIYTVLEESRIIQGILITLLAVYVSVLYYLIIMPRILLAIKAERKILVIYWLLISVLIAWVFIANINMPLPIDQVAVQKLEIIPIPSVDESSQMTVIEVKIDKRKIPLKFFDKGEGWEIQGRKLVHSGQNQGGITYLFINIPQSQIDVLFEEGTARGLASIVVNDIEVKRTSLNKADSGEAVVEIMAYGLVGPLWLVLLIKLTYVVALLAVVFWIGVFLKHPLNRIFTKFITFTKLDKYILVIVCLWALLLRSILPIYYLITNDLIYPRWRGTIPVVIPLLSNLYSYISNFAATFFNINTINVILNQYFRIMCFQGILDAIGCILVYKIICEINNSYKMALWGAIIYSMWMPSIFYASQLLAEATVPLLVLLITYTAIQTVKHEKQKIWFLCLGLLCSILLFTRLDNIFIVPALIVFYFVTYRKSIKRLILINVLFLLAFIGSSIIFNYLLSANNGVEIHMKYMTSSGGASTLLAIGNYNALGEYPATYKGLRFYRDKSSLKHSLEKADQYLTEKDEIFLWMYSISPQYKPLWAYIREVIIEKPVLYIDGLVRRFFRYLPSHPFFAAIIYILLGLPETGYRFSQIFNGLKYIDYLFFLFFLFGMWVSRKEKYTYIILAVYIGIHLFHVLSHTGEAYFVDEHEGVYLDPRYLIGMVTLWPIFMPMGIKYVYKNCICYNQSIKKLFKK